MTPGDKGEAGGSRNRPGPGFPDVWDRGHSSQGVQQEMGPGTAAPRRAQGQAGATPARAGEADGHSKGCRELGGSQPSAPPGCPPWSFPPSCLAQPRSSAPLSASLREQRAGGTAGWAGLGAQRGPARPRAVTSHAQLWHGGNRDLSSARGAGTLQAVQDSCPPHIPMAGPQELCAAFLGNSCCTSNIYLTIVLEIKLEKPNNGDFYLLESSPRARR